MSYVALVAELRRQAQAIDDDIVYGQGGEPETLRAAADALAALGESQTCAVVPGEDLEFTAYAKVHQLPDDSPTYNIARHAWKAARSETQ